jgi:hypothetical protein
VIYSLANSSAISASNLSAPIPQFINSTALLWGLFCIFGPDNSSTFVLDESSTIGYLVEQLASGLRASGSPPIVRQNFFAGILTIPLLFFQQNMINQNLFSVNSSIPIDDFPSGFDASVDLSESVVVGVIPHWTVIFYTALSSAIFLLCITGICLASLVQGPGISSFPLVDFASRILMNRENALAKVLARLREGRDGDVRRLLADKSFILKYLEAGRRSSTQGKKMIGLTIKT